VLEVLLCVRGVGINPSGSGFGHKKPEQKQKTRSAITRKTAANPPPPPRVRMMSGPWTCHPNIGEEGVKQDVVRGGNVLVCVFTTVTSVCGASIHLLFQRNIPEMQGFFGSKHF